MKRSRDESMKTKNRIKKKRSPPKQIRYNSVDSSPICYHCRLHYDRRPSAVTAERIRFRGFQELDQNKDFLSPMFEAQLSR